ncbi:MAG TPA: transglutaminase family protein [Beijerinckiaceae bacterium]|jgi:transglutaminase-like putative cysteine protease
MRIRITHDTAYQYERPVRSLIQFLRLTPRDHDGQHLLRWRIEPSADGRLRPQEDGLGNIVHVFSSEGPVEAITIRVLGEVETHETHGLVRDTIERVPEVYYLRETPLTLPDGEIKTFAEDTMGDVDADPLAALHRLLDGVKREVTYDVAPTVSTTTAAEAFALRRGVCQDLTHVFVAAARHAGIPARYVSGYFRRSDGVDDQEAGHAWAEAKVPSLGWVGFDAANGISISEAHVRLAIGLDYLGAAPIRGSRYGGGSETLAVKLTIDEARPQSQSQSQA